MPKRVRSTGPNQIAQERKQGWIVRVLKIIRNPLVILLSSLSAISFFTGDLRAGSVMVGMGALSVGFVSGRKRGPTPRRRSSRP